MGGNTNMESVLATEIQIGDTLNINTGYRPLDDENCKVLDIKREVTGLFPVDTISFLIDSFDYGKHWYDVPVEMRYGDKVYQTTMTKVN